MNKWLRVARRIAIENMCNGKTFSLGAILIKGGSVIATGTNKKKTDPVIAELSKQRFQTNRGQRTFRKWMHAELDCINRLDKKITKGTTIYVARVIKNFHTANAEPCLMCKIELTKAGIKKAHFTIDERSEGVFYF